MDATQELGAIFETRGRAPPAITAKPLRRDEVGDIFTSSRAGRGGRSHRHVSTWANHALASFRFIEMRCINSAWIIHVLHDCHYRPAQCRKIDAVQSAGRAEAGAGR